MADMHWDVDAVILISQANGFVCQAVVSSGGFAILRSLKCKEAIHFHALERLGPTAFGLVQNFRPRTWELGCHFNSTSVMLMYSRYPFLRFLLGNTVTYSIV